MIDRQEEFTGTRPVDGATQFDETRLADYMAAHMDGYEGPLTVRQFKGGQSNPTYLIEARSGTYVLRRRPPGKLLPSAHAVDREFRVISALHDAGFPVARPHLLCRDDDVIGTMFYIMDFVGGRVFWEPHLPTLEPGEREAVYDAMNDCIARLHNIDPAAAGLTDFGKPDGYIARQINRWSQQYESSASASIAEMDQLTGWLPGACPEQSGTAIVHGDYRLDNIILAPDRPEVLAVLDWELSTLGDPLGDFTYHLMQWHMPPSDTGAGVGSLVGHDLSALGIPGVDDYVARYCARTGRAGIDNLDFYFAYNFFRLAAILQGIAGRVRDGTAASPHGAAMETMVKPLAETAWRYAQKAGA